MIHNMDCCDYLSDTSPARAMFMDPPDNIGLEYKGYSDKLPANQYYGWLESIILQAMLKTQILWVSYYHRHDLMISSMIERVLRTRHPSWTWRKILWRFTFGQYRDTECGSGYRPILLLTAPSGRLYWDAIREVSARMLLGDARAAGPRVPDDVWEIPRVVGNSAERQAWHPTQHPEELMERIIRLSVTSNEHFVDLFGGSGTTLRVGRRLNLNCSVVEIDPYYCEKMK